MKTNCFKTTVLAVAVAVGLLIPLAIQAASTVTFDNKSGKPALVKLVGPTESSVTVENGEKQSLTVSPGHYFITVRYGTPGTYAYSKGDEFDVKETATTASDITITLHKVVAGNYGSKSISEAEFGGAGPSSKNVSSPSSPTFQSDQQQPPAPKTNPPPPAAPQTSVQKVIALALKLQGASDLVDRIKASGFLPDMITSADLAAISSTNLNHSIREALMLALLGNSDHDRAVASKFLPMAKGLR